MHIIDQGYDTDYCRDSNGRRSQFRNVQSSRSKWLEEGLIQQSDLLTSLKAIPHKHGNHNWSQVQTKKHVEVQEEAQERRLRFGQERASRVLTFNQL